MSLKQKIIDGLFWSFFSRGGEQICQFTIGIILARILDPQDFGLIAMATVITNFFSIFADFGFSQALIYKQNIRQDHLSSVFWLNILLGTILTLGLACSTPLVVYIYKRPELAAIFIFLSFNFVLNSFSIVQHAVLTKNMDFKSLTLRDMTVAIVSGIVGITYALSGFGVWSLVAKALTATLINCVFLWTLSSWRPSFIISKKAIKELFNYSAHVTGASVFFRFAQNIDRFLIGRFFGPLTLGLYARADTLALFSRENITQPIIKVMFPALSQTQSDITKINSTYVRMVKYTSLITLPLMCGLLMLAPEFIKVVYGQKWKAVIPLFQVMCLLGMLRSVTTPIMILLSQGRAQHVSRLSIIQCIIVTASVVIGLPFGIFWVVCFYTIGQTGWIIYAQWLANQAITLKTGLFLSSIGKGAFIGAIILMGIGLFRMVLRTTGPITLISAVCLGLILYGWLIFILERKMFDKILESIRQKLADIVSLY